MALTRPQPTPNPAQESAIIHSPGPLMILAGAGTGKTFTLLRRISHQIKTGKMSAKNIVLLTFTERATIEAKEKILNIIGSKGSGIVVSTFHGFCHSILREFGPSEMVDRVLWQDSDIVHYLIDHFDELDELSSRTFKTDPVVAITTAFIPFFSRLKDELITPEYLEKYYAPKEWSREWVSDNFPALHAGTDKEEAALQLQDLIQVYHWFQSAKAREKALDFGDMLLHCYTLLRGTPVVLKKVQNRYRHFFIDEYQDNNFALNKIINLISARYQSITVVGDEDQCIYSFRGANYYNIQDFIGRYGNHSDFSVIRLEENRRSTQEILTLANASIINNTRRNLKILETPKTNPKHGPIPKWTIAESRDTKSEVPTLIKRLTETGKTVYGDIAVICRSWTNVKDMANALAQKAIAVDLHIEKFFHVPIVKNVIAWAHLIQGDDRSQQALYRILIQTTGESQARSFFSITKKLSLNEKMLRLREIIDNDPTDLLDVRPLEKMLESYEHLIHKLEQKQNAAELVWEILTVLKTNEQMQDMRNSYRYAERLNLANMGKLLTLVEKFVNLRPEKQGSLSGWLRYLDALEMSGNIPAVQPDLPNRRLAVQILTVHQSKGLQYPVVIIPFLRQNTFPMSFKRHTMVDRLPESWMKWGQEGSEAVVDHFEEERRVFYVACTRAENELYLFGPKRSQSDFSKELETLKPKVMEKITMVIETQNKNEEISESLQQMMADLNREISAGEFENARVILDTMESVEHQSTLPKKLSKNREVIHENLITLSSTSIGDYQDCPLKYRLKHQDKVPEQKTQSTLEFGKIMHDILFDFHGLDAIDQTLDNLIELFNKHWRQDAFEYRQRENEFNQQGRELLENYFNHNQEHRPVVVGREKKFKFDLPEIGVSITGKIDRIDRDGDLLRVVDYKTSRKKGKAKDSLQMALYTEALSRDAVDDIEGNPGSAVLHFLRHGDDPESIHTFSEKELSDQQEKIAKVTQGIRERNFEPRPNEYGVCKWCDYKDFICPAWEE